MLNCSFSEVKRRLFSLNAMLLGAGQNLFRRHANMHFARKYSMQPEDNIVNLKCESSLINRNYNEKPEKLRSVHMTGIACPLSQYDNERWDANR